MKIKNTLFILTLCIILFLGFKLRVERFSAVPFPGESLDEYSNAWVGLSLIETGMPLGESGLSGYSNVLPKYINVDRIYQGTAMGNSLPMSYPWFDHPPLMGLITGGYSYLNGGRVFEDTVAAVIRKPIIVISTLSIALAAYLALLVFGWPTAIVSAAVMATSPLMVIDSRMVQAENGFVPIFLLAMILLWYYLKKHNIWLLSTIACLAGLGMLFKLSAVVIPIVCVIVLIASKKDLLTKTQEILIFSVITGSIFGLFFVYGAALDIGTFWSVFTSNSNRVYGIGLNAISELITQTKVTGGKYLSDGWPLAGWLGLLMLMQKWKTTRLIWLPIAAYLAIYLFFGSEPYGWYRIPFLPFLIIIASWLVMMFLKNIRWTAISLIALLMPLGMNFEKYIEVNKIPKLVTIWRIGVPLLVSLSVALVFLPQKKWIKNIVYVLMFALIFLCLYTNWLRTEMLTVDYWYKVN